MKPSESAGNKPDLGPTGYPTRRRSRDKTDPDLGNALSALSRSEASPREQATAEEQYPNVGTGNSVAEPPDTVLLKEEIEARDRECAALRHTVEELRTEINALRADFSVVRSEHSLENQALKELVAKARTENARLEEELGVLGRDTKRLKEQNLDLQYQLGSSGMPVPMGSDAREGSTPTPPWGGYFPILTPLPGGNDPIPVMLRGELSSFFFPDLLHFLANSQLLGVLTITTDGIVSKLYFEKTILRLAGWNNRDPELSLATLLEESELVSRATIDEFRALPPYDLELAESLMVDKAIPSATVRAGLKEHARVILSYLFQLKRGDFFFQPGQIPRKRDLQFQLPITDLLLKTAAEMDEKTRELAGLETL